MLNLDLVQTTDPAADECSVAEGVTRLKIEPAVTDRFLSCHDGKLDKAALPDPFERVASIPIETSSRVINIVGEAWEAILDKRPSSKEINFFDAGGTSLDALRLYELLSERFACKLDPTFVFEYPTIRHQAEALKSLQRSDDLMGVGGRGQRRRNAVASGTRGRK